MSSASLEALHALRERLCGPELDQGHLFTGWPTTPEAYTPSQLALLRELEAFRVHYHGGVEQYIRNGKSLLTALEKGDAAYLALDKPPLLFDAPRLDARSARLDALESLGARLVRETAFVLVAGGLGERLGYSGIKVGLPVETATGRTYLEHYLSWICALGGAEAPVVIMTSSDTHDATLALLARLALPMPNVRLLKQETVFCFHDSAAHLAQGKNGELLRKPHGHGDVHSLLSAATAPDPGDASRQIPLVEAWMKRGYRYVCFFQDTNAMAVFTIPVSLAISEEAALDVNFTCIPRQPKEAVGLMCRVQVKEEGAATPCWKTINIEYNTFADVARSLTAEGGDCAVQGGAYSPFPGNINTLLIRLPIYAEKLREFKGQVPEFINPKFTDDTHRAFKKPSRVESLMQDIALLFSEAAGERVGGTVFDRFTFQPVKNSLEEAVAKVRAGMEPYCPCSGEADFYEFARRRLRAVGVMVEGEGSDAALKVRGSIPVGLFPIITLDAVARGDGSLAGLAGVFPNPDRVRIAAGAVLLVEGRVVIQSLELRSGALRVVGPREANAAPLVVRDLCVEEAGWGLEAASETAGEVDTMRGYVLVKRSCVVFDGSAKM